MVYKPDRSYRRDLLTYSNCFVAAPGCLRHVLYSANLPHTNCELLLANCVTLLPLVNGFRPFCHSVSFCRFANSSSSVVLFHFELQWSIQNKRAVKNVFIIYQGFERNMLTNTLSHHYM